MKYLVLCLALGHLAYSATNSSSSLSNDLEELKLENKLTPTGIDKEKYYAVQTRSIPLKHHLELSVGGGKNFSPGSFVTSQNIDGSIHFYFTDRFYTALSGSYVANKLSDAGVRLEKEQGMFPDIAQVRLRTDLTLGYHLFYGKFRVSMDDVFYFDQYWALGGGMVQIQNVASQLWTPAIVADAGFAFWFGNNWSVRLGLKDYFFKETRSLSSNGVQHFVGHATLGYVFGG